MTYLFFFACVIHFLGTLINQQMCTSLYILDIHKSRHLNVQYTQDEMIAYLKVKLEQNLKHLSANETKVMDFNRNMLIHE
jgi:hypothetical protein